MTRSNARSRNSSAAARKDSVRHSLPLRDLDLPDAAEAFEALWSSPTVQRLTTDDSYEATDDDIAELERLAEAVGSHDRERVALARGHPEVFSI